MKITNLFLALTLLFFLGCKDEEPMEEPTFIDNLVGTHIGKLEEYNCSASFDLIGTISMDAEILETSDSTINVSLNNAAGEFLNFDGVINSDTTFAIIEFEDNGTTFKGSGKLIDKLQIFLGNGCTIFGTEAAIFQWKQN